MKSARSVQPFVLSLARVAVYQYQPRFGCRRYSGEVHSFRTVSCPLFTILAHGAVAQPCTCFLEGWLWGKQREIPRFGYIEVVKACACMHAPYTRYVSSSADRHDSDGLGIFSSLAHCYLAICKRKRVQKLMG